VRAIPQLFPSAQFMGFGTVKGRLYDFGAYPGFLPGAAGLDVLGEVYAVDEAAVNEIDEIERYVEGDDAECFYFRREHVIALRGGGTVTAWLYECNPNHYDCTTPMTLNDWIAFASAKGALPEEVWPDGAPIKK
jgi:gamma-glutamylcyclotransferase (GGCT)/AIG2-like uncharacterized protein YtfP